MDALKMLEELFARFPGIGPRQARRFAFYVLSRPASAVHELAEAIENAKKHSHECRQCRRIFMMAGGRSSICAICGDTGRDGSSLMIVSRDSDLESIEKSGAYRGLYFVLGGTVPILDKEPDKRIRLKALLERVVGSPEIREVIISLSTTPDGEHTENIIREALGKIIGDRTLIMSVLGRGLSTGAELEYADQETIKNALKNRSKQ